MVLTTSLFRRIAFIFCGMSMIVFTACNDDTSKQKQSTTKEKNASTPKEQTDKKITKEDQPTETKPNQKEKTVLFVPPISDQSEDRSYNSLQNESVLELPLSDVESGSDNLGNLDAPAPPIYKTEEQIYTFVDPQASFPGGNTAMFEYLRKNIRYPQDAKENLITGKCYIQFVVKSDGSIGNVRVLRGVYPSLDNEAIRLVKSMPVWIPAQLDGKNVNSYFNLPIKFELEK